MLASLHPPQCRCLVKLELLQLQEKVPKWLAKAESLAKKGEGQKEMATLARQVVMAMGSGQSRGACLTHRLAAAGTAAPSTHLHNRVHEACVAQVTEAAPTQDEAAGVRSQHARSE